MIDYHIISSGSKGNCVVINRTVMVDCGIAFNKLKDYLYDVKYLIITHIHQDHLKLKTLTQISSQFPRIKIIGNYEVHQVFPCHYIANSGFNIETEDFVFTPFQGFHDVLVYGYVWTDSGNRIIYCTDTSSLEEAPDGLYDYFFLESNHDENKLEEARGKPVNGYDPYLSGKRHLSTQQCKAFFYMHRSNPNAELIELHKSTRFY